MEQRKYKSKRLEGIQGKWDDIEFLLYIKDRVSFGSNHQDLKDASDARIRSIIEKLGELKCS